MRAHRRGKPRGRAVDDQHRHERYGGERRADRAHRPRGRPDRAPHGAGAPRGRESRQHRAAAAQRRFPHGHRGRHPLRSGGCGHRGEVRRQGAHQPGQLPHGARRAGGAHRAVPRARRGAAHRRQPRVAGEARFRRVGRHAPGHGGLGHGVFAGVPGVRFRSGGGLDEVVEHARHGRRLPSAGRGDGYRRYALSDPSGRHRGRERHRGAREERRGHRGADGRRHRRHDPRLADRGPRK